MSWRRRFWPNVLKFGVQFSFDSHSEHCYTFWFVFKSFFTFFYIIIFPTFSTTVVFCCDFRRNFYKSKQTHATYPEKISSLQKWIVLPSIEENLVKAKKGLAHVCSEDSHHSRGSKFKKVSFCQKKVDRLQSFQKFEIFFKTVVIWHFLTIYGKSYNQISLFLENFGKN